MPKGGQQVDMKLFSGGCSALSGLLEQKIGDYSLQLLPCWPSIVMEVSSHTTAVATLAMIAGTNSVRVNHPFESGGKNNHLLFCFLKLNILQN